MILVNVKATWRRVLAGRLSGADATLGRWHRIPDFRIEEYGDAVAGVYRGRFVSVYDIEGYTATTTSGSRSPAPPRPGGATSSAPRLRSRGCPVRVAR